MLPFIIWSDTYATIGVSLWPGADFVAAAVIHRRAQSSRIVDFISQILWTGKVFYPSEILRGGFGGNNNNCPVSPPPNPRKWKYDALHTSTWKGKFTRETQPSSKNTWRSSSSDRWVTVTTDFSLWEPICLTCALHPIASTWRLWGAESRIIHFNTSMQIIFQNHSMRMKTWAFSDMKQM